MAVFSQAYANVFWELAGVPCDGRGEIRQLQLHFEMSGSGGADPVHRFAVGWKRVENVYYMVAQACLPTAITSEIRSCREAK